MDQKFKVHGWKLPMGYQMQVKMKSLYSHFILSEKIHVENKFPNPYLDDCIHSKSCDGQTQNRIFLSLSVLGF